MNEFLLNQHHNAWAQNAALMRELAPEREAAADGVSDVVEHALLHVGQEVVIGIAHCHPAAEIGLLVALLGGSHLAGHELGDAVNKLLGGE